MNNKFPSFLLEKHISFVFRYLLLSLNNRINTHLQISTYEEVTTKKQKTSIFEAADEPSTSSNYVLVDESDFDYLCKENENYKERIDVLEED